MPLGPHARLGDGPEPDSNFCIVQMAQRVAATYPEVDDLWLTALFGLAFCEGYTRSQHGLPNPYS